MRPVPISKCGGVKKLLKKPTSDQAVLGFEPGTSRMPKQSARRLATALGGSEPKERK
jgi:hypothetical protein